MEKRAFVDLMQQISQCKICASSLEHGCRPVIQAHPKAKILIIGQAPGLKVHTTGSAFNDASGDRLRQWMGVDKTTFYQADKIAIMPMGFCYPGKGKSGDLPPRKECAPQWHQAVLEQLSNIELVLLIGQYAQGYYLDDKPSTLTETVQNWQQWAELNSKPRYLPLPHPSPRNNIWLKKNPWFEQQVVPNLQKHVFNLLQH